MYRVVKLTGTWYALQIEDQLDDEGIMEDHIKPFVESGEPVMIISELSDLDDILDTEYEDIQVVELD